MAMAWLLPVPGVVTGITQYIYIIIALLYILIKNKIKSIKGPQKHKQNYNNKQN